MAPVLSVIYLRGMTRRAQALTIAATLLAGGASAQTPTPAEVPPVEIGTWRLSCVTDRMTDRADCPLPGDDGVSRESVAALRTAPGRLALRAVLRALVSDFGSRRLWPTAGARDDCATAGETASSVACAALADGSGGEGVVICSAPAIADRTCNR